MRGHPWTLLLLGFAGFCLTLAGCSNDDAVLGDLPVLPPPGVQVSLSGDVQPIFNNHCAIPGCHAGSPPAQNLSLEAGNTFNASLGLVNVTSLEAPALKRVEPADSAASYLVHKLEGTQVGAGGSGTQMPQGAQPLADVEIQIIKDWIDQGAQDN